MTESNFTTHGDQEIEARIVAWVLGEASAFEAAELKRLCEERPELAVFKRRIKAVHGLLGEASHPLPSQQWKLPESKRRMVLSLMETEQVAAIREAALDARVSFSARRALLAIAACVLITLVALPLMTMRKAPMMRAEAPMIVTYSIDPAEDNEEASDAFAPPRPRMVLQPLAKAKPAAQPKRDELRRKEVSDAPADASNRPGVVASQAGSDIKVPVPQSEVTEELSVDVGDGANFGEGWGYRSGAGRAVPAPSLAPPAAPASDPFAAPGETHSTHARAGKIAESRARGLDREVPTLGDVPAAGRLFKNEHESRVDGMTNGIRSGNHAIQGKAVDEVLLEKPAGMQPMNDFYQLDGKPGDAKDGVSPETAEGNERLSRFKEGKKGEKDLSDLASRRNLDRAVDTQSDYYRAAYDHTRAQLLNEVDKGWELQVPGNVVSGEQAPATVGAWLVDGNVKGSLFAGDRSNGEPQSGLKALEEIDSQSHGYGYSSNPTSNSPAILAQAAQGGFKKDLSLLFETRSDAGEVEKILRGGREGELLKQVDPQDKTADVEDGRKVEDKPASALDQEVLAAEEPYSTFSLNVSDASFQVAQAALAKGEMPDPAGIKVEQFYNAVDYGDPSPAAGEPVTARIEQVAHPQLPGRTLVRVAVKTGASGRNQGQPLRLTLLVDQSGSMSREDRLAGMNKALEGLATLLTPQDRVQVIGFSRNAHLLAEDLSGDQAAGISGLIHQEASEGGTNLEQALELGERIAQRSRAAGAQNRVVLFTDGAANLGDADPQSLTKRIERMRQQGISFDIAGIVADGLNDELLGDLARHGNGRYYVVGKGEGQDFANQLAGAFRPAAENVKVQVHFNPERVSRYRLIGFEKDRLNKEDFRNDAVDAAEMAAEEAGVAIYQVETLPEGKGEMGEVSVRFREMASGQMVERSWALTHQDKVAALDRSTPSMKLAVLAMLAAEKLKGGPLADAIDFKELSAVSAAVREAYPSNQRTAELLGMLEQLK